MLDVYMCKYMSVYVRRSVDVCFCHVKCTSAKQREESYAVRSE